MDCRPTHILRFNGGSFRGEEDRVLSLVSHFGILRWERRGFQYKPNRYGFPGVAKKNEYKVGDRIQISLNNQIMDAVKRLSTTPMVYGFRWTLAMSRPR